MLFSWCETSLQQKQSKNKNTKHPHLEARTFSCFPPPRQNPPNVTTLLDPSHVTDDVQLCSHEKARTCLGQKTLQTGTLPLVHSHVYCSCMLGVYFSVQFTLFPLPKRCPALTNLICRKKFKPEVGSTDLAALHACQDSQTIVSSKSIFLYTVKLYQSSLLNGGKSLLTAQLGHTAKSPNHQKGEIHHKHTFAHSFWQLPFITVFNSREVWGSKLADFIHVLNLATKSQTGIECLAKLKIKLHLYKSDYSQSHFHTGVFTHAVVTFGTLLGTDSSPEHPPDPLAIPVTNSENIFGNLAYTRNLGKASHSQSFSHIHSKSKARYKQGSELRTEFLLLPKPTG